MKRVKPVNQNSTNQSKRNTNSRHNGIIRKPFTNYTGIVQPPVNACDTGMPAVSLLALIEADIGVAPHKAADGQYGPEYASACPGCGEGVDRLRSWPERISGKFPGRYWCRVCNRSGDTIQYLMEFRRMPYRRACELLGISPVLSGPTPRTRVTETQRPDPIAGREIIPPPRKWQENAVELSHLAENQLRSKAGAAARAYIRGRGLSLKMMRHFRLGWIPAPSYCDPAEWGIPEELHEDGRTRKLLIPPGILIPHSDAAGRLLGLRVRYWTKEHGSKPPDDKTPKYRMVRGSATLALIFGTGPAGVVVESDLDALLIGQDAGDLVTAVALGSVSTPPDEHAAELLRASPVIFVSFDTDQAGGKAAWKQWSRVRNAVIWPIPAKYGKDPGEAREKGLDLRAWIHSGLEVVGAVPPG